jgi:hypothetical protein
MRYFGLFLLFASLTLFSIGCGQTDQPSADPSPAETGDAAMEADAEPAADADAEPAADAEPEKEAEEGSSE